jgi:hypothetical protein
MPDWPVHMGHGADGAAGDARLQPLAAQCGALYLVRGDFLLLALPLAGRIRAKLQAEDVLMLAVLSLVGNLLYFILLAAAIQLVGIAPPR